MTHKASALSMVWNDGKRESQALKATMIVVLSLVAVALAVASVYVLVTGLRPEAGSGIAAGIEASTARWAALGELYAHDYEAVAAVDSARYSGLGAQYLSKIAAGVEASSARWAALGTYQMVRYEAAAAASSARYQALGEWYAATAAQAE